MRGNIYLVIFLAFIIIIQVHAREEERSFLDNFLPIFRLIKKVSSDAFRRIVESPRSRQLLRRNNKELIIPDNINFPCDLSILKRSPVVPKTAHEVRPGDIDVIGGIGDSLTAAFGASATTLFDALSEDRGRSFSVGGQGTWRTSLTLPNILKMFNPNLIGYSLRTSTTLDKESQFNVAEGGAISTNMPYMAKVLVKRIKMDPRVNIKKDWKMITFMIGDNDFCTEMCYYKNPEVILYKHKQDLLDVLRILKDNLPRTIVNIIPPPHQKSVKVLHREKNGKHLDLLEQLEIKKSLIINPCTTNDQIDFTLWPFLEKVIKTRALPDDLRLLTLQTDKPPICRITHTVECPCLSNSYRNRRKLFFNIMRKWQELDIEISNYPEFDLDEFTVIPHYYTLEYTVPTTIQGKTDYSYFSEDCFHFSEKGQSRFANDLWNSIMEPFGNKSTDGSETFSKFKCPTDKHPFIYTRRNSV